MVGSKESQFPAALNYMPSSSVIITVFQNFRLKFLLREFAILDNRAETSDASQAAAEGFRALG